MPSLAGLAVNPQLDQDVVYSRLPQPYPDELRNGRLERALDQVHSRLSRRFRPLIIIAPFTARHTIFPIGFSAF